MSFFFWAALKAFMPPALFSAVYADREQRGWPMLLMALTTIGVALASRWLFAFDNRAHFFLAIFTLLAWLMAVVGLFWRSRRVRFWLLMPLWLSCGLQFAANGALDEFSPTYVVNNTVILNSFALCFAAAWLILIYHALTALRRLLAQQPYHRAMMTLKCVYLLLPLVYVLSEAAAQALLAAIRLQWVEMSALLLRLIAKANVFVNTIHYVNAATLLLTAVLIFSLAYRPRILAARQSVDIIPRRLRTAAARTYLHSAIMFSALAITLAIGSWYWVAIASQPPRLSAAQQVEMSADQHIHIPIEGLDDGDLHRFAWISSSGRVVRFFVINRYPDRHALAVVFDACQLCGDDGYIMRDNQLECISCGVRLFLPSVGQMGGCNPIPIDGWTEDATEIRVPRSGLERGEMLFSTVVSLDVADPVDGTMVNNQSAQWQYRYGTQTYYFASEENYRRFVEDPEQFIPDTGAQQ